MADRFFVFHLIDEYAISRLREAQNSDEAKDILLDIFGDYVDIIRTEDESSPVDLRYKTDALSELLHSALVFAVEQDFTDEKMSCVIEMAFRVFKSCVERNHESDKAFELVKAYALRHALFRPPHSIALFSLAEVKAVLDYFRWGFLRHYGMFRKAFCPELHYEIVTFQPFKSSLPEPGSLGDGVAVNKDELSVLDVFNKDKEIKLTREEIEEIMRGESVHNIPEWKRQEIIKKHLETLRQEKVDRFLKKELEKLHQKFQEKMQEQDAEFEKKLSETKPKK